MSLSKLEAAILEAAGNYLKDTPKLGLSIHKELEPENEHGSQFKWSNIESFFRTHLNGTKCVHIDPICAAFAQTHSYMFVNNPKFELSFRQNMNSTQYAIPMAEQDLAIEIFHKITDDLTLDNPNEKDSGWHPELKEIVDMTTNADNRTAKPSKPPFGGGPSPKGDHNIGSSVANMTDLDATEMV